MKHKVSELEGARLDAAVAKALGRTFSVIDGYVIVRDWQGKDSMVQGNPFDPSTNWRQGGPIIERERIALWHGNGAWYATMPEDSSYPGNCDYIDATDRDSRAGPTPLIAAMRSYVASKFGDEVEL